MAPLYGILFGFLFGSIIGLIECSNSASYPGIVSLKLNPASILRPGQTHLYETYYYTEIQIGQPFMPFKTLFHINCQESILPKSQSSNHSNGVYNSRLSYHSSLQYFRSIFHYNVHQFNGETYRDQMSVYSYDRLISFPFFFMATQDTVKFYQVFGREYDAAIGLHSLGSSFRGGFLQALLSSGLIQSKQYSLSFEAKNQPGTLMIGATNGSSYEGQLNLHQSKYPTRFEFKLDRITLGSRVICKTSSVGFDNSFSDLRGAGYKVKEIYDLLGVRVRIGLPILPDATNIDDLPTLNFVLDGVQYAYPPEVYVNRAGNISYLAIQQNLPGLSSEWTFGTDFMSIYYTAYDLNTATVGIAPMRRR